ncbi:zinc-dependent alcohol dehydrogenase family protein [Larkinella humicola]|uniref:Zinc-dependent alcohol dehydrogenase family protein n=1 Tax=Larkinella humicola TaxID=2607654 RepID=A0A5N1JDH1_9BACT|nr:zinc-dependent alcohol dehydrogenase family protein [Larkinella humicola]KAA9353163.1 zinc-dependent alcohol dehydrogenase family protein [Larkinella humicola]
MQTVNFSTIGKPADTLQVIDTFLPEPGPGEVRIKVIASPINPSDLMFVQNLYGIQPELPSGAGFEGVGIVDALGEGVTMRTGIRVSFTAIGAWSEYVLANQRSLIPVPDALSDEVAAQLFVNPFSAYAMLEESGLQPGQWVLLTAAGSSFSKLVIQLCKLKGIQTIGTVRHNELDDELKALGITAIVNTEKEKLTNRVKALTEGKGVTCVLEAVGGNTASDALKCLAKGGTMILYGVLSMQNPSFNVGLMIFRELTIKGFWLTDWMRRVDSQTRQNVARNVITLLVGGQIQVPVEATYPLSEIKKAVEHSEQAGRHGKILIKV